MQKFTLPLQTSKNHCKNSPFLFRPQKRSGFQFLPRTLWVNLTEKHVAYTKFSLPRVKTSKAPFWHQPSFKDRGMGCAKVTHLRLTNSRLCAFYVKMNYFEAHLMVSSTVVDSKAEDGHSCNVRNFTRFLFDMNL